MFSSPLTELKPSHEILFLCYWVDYEPIIPRYLINILYKYVLMNLTWCECQYHVTFPKSKTIYHLYIFNLFLIFTCLISHYPSPAHYSSSSIMHLNGKKNKNQSLKFLTDLIQQSKTWGISIQEKTVWTNMAHCNCHSVMSINKQGILLFYKIYGDFQINQIDLYKIEQKCTVCERGASYCRNLNQHSLTRRKQAFHY